MRVAVVKTGLLASAALTLVAAVPQDAQTPSGVGGVTLPPSAVPTPAAPTIVLPTLAPTPAASPRAPKPKLTATPSSRITPTPKPTPRPSASPTPTASPSAVATPGPSPSVNAPTPAATPTATPRPSPSQTPTIAAPRREPAADRTSLWLIVIALILLSGIAAVLFWWRRRRAAQIARPVRPTRPPPPPTTPPPSPGSESVAEASNFWTPSQPARLPDPIAPPLPPAPPPRPNLDIGISPRRAGLNLLSATAEIEVLVRNDGDAPATNVAIDVRLLNAQSGQDSELGALFAAAMARPAVPPFAIEPGEERTVRAVATLPRDAIVPLMAADRPMFVPVIAVDVRYDRGDGARGQTAAAFAIGVVREGSEKLAPFWLDTTPRMYDTIAARPHSFSVRS